MITRTVSRSMHLENGTRVLRFVQSPAEPVPPDGEYVVRGGICWPVIVDRESGQMQGFALVAGLHIKTRVVWVLAQTPFVTVDHVQDEHGAIKFAGLSTWFNEAWSQWFCSHYGWHQPYETNRRYLIQVLHSPMIQPKPVLVELDWQDNNDARAIIAEHEVTDRLRYEGDSPLHTSLLEFSVSEPADRDRFPAVQALTCALTNIDEVAPRKDT